MCAGRMTIPAAFDQMQWEATMRAADGTGLERWLPFKNLLRRQWLRWLIRRVGMAIFSSTISAVAAFDVAIVQTKLPVAATVVGHAGINMLGGRDFDRAMVNTIVRPWLF